MSLKLMYITNRPDVALIAEAAGVDRIFIDMEYIGKASRQGGMDSVQNHHTVEDVKNIRSVLTKAGRHFVEQKFDRNIVINRYLDRIKMLNLL